MFSDDLEERFFDLDKIGLCNRPMQFTPIAAIGAPGARVISSFEAGLTGAGAAAENG
jgi:hypothetical protein